jgi:hypothetical protein
MSGTSYSSAKEIFFVERFRTSGNGWLDTEQSDTSV